LVLQDILQNVRVLNQSRGGPLERNLWLHYLELGRHHFVEDDVDLNPEHYEEVLRLQILRQLVVALLVELLGELKGFGQGYYLFVGLLRQEGALLLLNRLGVAASFTVGETLYQAGRFHAR